MRISFAPSDTGVVGVRTCLDNMAGTIARVFVSSEEADEALAGTAVDAMLRYAAYSDNPDAVVIRLWDRQQGIAMSNEITILADRIHIY